MKSKIVSFMKKNYYMKLGALGLILSLLWVFLVNTQPFSDFDYYNKLAVQIANGGAWGDTYTSVGYAIILGGIYKIFGARLLTAKLFNVFLSILGYIFLYEILKKVSLNEKKKKLIYGIFVLFPNCIFYNSILGTEILFTTILLLITLLFFSKCKFKYFFIGILTAVNTMIKPFFIVFFFAVFLTLLIRKVKFMEAIKHSLIVLIVSLLCISPWAYRNTKLTGNLTFVSNNGGIVLYINNNSENKYGRWMEAAKVQNSVVNTKEYKAANMSKKNEMLKNAAKKWILSHPGQFLILGFKRLVNTYFIGDDISYSLNGTGISGIIYALIVAYANIAKLLLFIPAMFYIIKSSIQIIKSISRKEDIDSFEIYCLICFYMFTAVYFITEGQGRYAYPTILFAIFFFSKIVDKKFN